MGFPQPAIIVFDGTISANAFASWVKIVDVNVNIPLAKGESITDGSLFLKVTVPPHIVEGTVSLFLNDSFLDQMNIDGFQIFDLTKSITHNIPATLFRNGNNKVTIKCDTGDPTASLDFRTYCDMNYSTNIEAPVNGGVTGSSDSGNPSTGGGGDIFKGLFDFLKDPFSAANIPKTIILGAAVVVGTLVLVKVASGGRSIPIILPASH